MTEINLQLTADIDELDRCRHGTGDCAWMYPVYPDRYDGDWPLEAGRLEYEKSLLPKTRRQISTEYTLSMTMSPESTTTGATVRETESVCEFEGVLDAIRESASDTTEYGFELRTGRADSRRGYFVLYGRNLPATEQIDVVDEPGDRCGIRIELGLECLR